MGFFPPGCSKGGSGGPGPARGSLAGQNLLLITLDTIRADRLGCYGYSAAETPNLDRLAKQGVLFERAYAQVPMTLPSHCSIMTGRYPKELGVHVNGRNALSPSAVTLAEVFRAEQYATAAFVASFVLDSRFGLDQGFDTYDDAMGTVALNNVWHQWQQPADKVTDAALKWFSSRPDQRPFFAWVHYYDPHEPYAAPEPFASRHADPYDAEIAFMDAQIGRLLEGVAARSAGQQTLVVVVGDHGESLGEHGIHGHSLFLYEDVLHVPLIVVHPSAIAQARRVDAVVEAADVFLTMLELFGLQPPGDLLTRSLADGLRGGKLPDGSAYAESLSGMWLYRLAQQRALITRDHKYISSTDPELYDLKADAKETKNIAIVEKDVAGRLMSALQRRYEEIPKGDGAPVAMDGATKAALASLGYLQAEAQIVDEFLTPGLDDPKTWIPRLAAVEEGRHLMVGDRFAEAIPIWEKLAETNDSADILASLGTCYLRTGAYEEARTVLTKAIQSPGDNLLAMISMGDLLVELGELEEAEKHYRIAAAAASPNPQVFAKLGDVLIRLRRPDDAIEHYRKTLETYDQFPAIHARLAALLAEKGLTSEAVPHLQKAAMLNQDDTYIRDQIARTYYQIGLEYARANKHEEAAAAFEQALRTNPSVTSAAEQLSGYYLQIGKTAEAVRVLRTAQAGGGDARGRFVLANLLATSRDDGVRNGAEAVQWAQQALSMSEAPRPPDIAIVAAAYAEAGRFDMAVETAQRALDAAQSAGDAQLANVLDSQLELYRAGKPFRHPRF
jgi:arylsulfatase A-like enzyme/Tfp pilus assembly protein PilF